MNITLSWLHNLLSEAYAISVNDTLYFVVYETDFVNGEEILNPYISLNGGEDYVSLEKVDGDIEYNEKNNSVFFYINEEPIEIKFLVLMDLSDELSNMSWKEMMRKRAIENKKRKIL